LRSSSEQLENVRGSAELNSAKMRMATQTPAAADLMWVADTSAVYWCCFLAKTKFSNVQGGVLSADLTLPKLMHPSTSQSWRGSLWPGVRSGPFPRWNLPFCWAIELLSSSNLCFI